jgi:hypothetical protein
MKEKIPCTFLATIERKPIVAGGSVKLPDGREIKFKSKNEYKQWRKQAQKDIAKARKRERIMGI